jgi:large subunit ribosomal protein L6
MSRIGRKPISVPSGVDITLNDSVITVKGPKGSLSRQLHKDMKVTVQDNVITVERPSDNKQHRSLHGTTRSVVANMVSGVTEGFSKSLELVGVGYRANKSGNKLVLNVGYSHPVEIVPEDGIEFEVPAATKIIVKGIDKERVGATAAKIRSVREPEPYKGKGIKYEGERIIRKEGKAGKKK